MPREFGTDPYGILARGAPVAPRDDGPIGGIGGGMGGIRAPVGRGTFGVGRGSGAIGGRGAIAGMGYKTDIGRSSKVKKKAKGGSVKSSASKRGDGIATKGKTKGRFV